MCFVVGKAQNRNASSERGEFGQKTGQIAMKTPGEWGFDNGFANYFAESALHFRTLIATI
jgi:hypothetical protein